MSPKIIEPIWEKPLPAKIEAGIHLSLQIACWVSAKVAAALATIPGIGWILAAITLLFSVFFGFFGGERKPRPSIAVYMLVLPVKRNGKLAFQISAKMGPTEDLQDPKEIFDCFLEAVKGLVDSLNKEVFPQIPGEYVDFIIKYLHPMYETTYIVSGIGIENFRADFNKKAELPILEVQRMSEDANRLFIIKLLGLDGSLERHAQAILPDVSYQVEGLWRKELEKLSIKLLQRREYTRQLRNILDMMVVLQEVPSDRTCEDIFLGRWTASIPRYNFPSYPSGNINWHIIRAYWGYEGQEGLQAIAGNSWSKLAAIRSSLRGPLPSAGITCYRNGLYGTYYRIEGNANIIFKPVREGTKIKIVPVVDVPYWEIYAGRTGRCPGLPTGANMAYHRMLQKYLDIFTNYLFSEIPGEAAEYIVKNLSANQAYMEKFVIFLNKVPYHYVRDAYWLPNISVTGYKWAPAGYPLYCQWSFDALPPSNAIRTGTEQNVLRGDHCWTHQYRQSCIRGNFSHPNNIPEKINALMQDTIDLYNIWMRGYGEEWKKRIYQKLFDQLLPEIREHLRPSVETLAAPYMKIPTEMIEPTKREIAKTEIEAQKGRVDEAIKYFEETKKRKDEIIKYYGKEEWVRLSTEIRQEIQDVVNEVRMLVAQYMLPTPAWLEEAQGWLEEMKVKGPEDVLLAPPVLAPPVPAAIPLVETAKRYWWLGLLAYLVTKK